MHIFPVPVPQITTHHRITLPFSGTSSTGGTEGRELGAVLNSPGNTLIARRTSFPRITPTTPITGLEGPGLLRGPHSSLGGSQGRRRMGATGSWPQDQCSQGPHLTFQGPSEVGLSEHLAGLRHSRQSAGASGKIPCPPWSSTGSCLRQLKPSCAGGDPPLSRAKLDHETSCADSIGAM